MPKKPPKRAPRKVPKQSYPGEPRFLDLSTDRTPSFLLVQEEIVFPGHNAEECYAMRRRWQAEVRRKRGSQTN